MEKTGNDFVRFTLNFDKCIEGIDLIAQRKPDISQYYICKIFYFADKAHLLDWGRPISGDRYVAMQHGPVPSTIYDLLKDPGTEPDEIIDLITSRIEITRGLDNRLKVRSKGLNYFRNLSGTDIEYLEDAIQKYCDLDFGEVRKISHSDPAYEEAWAKSGANNEMDIRLWLKNTDIDDTKAIKQLKELFHPSLNVVN